MVPRDHGNSPGVSNGYDYGDTRRTVDALHSRTALAHQFTTENAARRTYGARVDVLFPTKGMVRRGPTPL